MNSEANESTSQHVAAAVAATAGSPEAGSQGQPAAVDSAGTSPPVATGEAGAAGQGRKWVGGVWWFVVWGPILLGASYFQYGAWWSADGRDARAMAGTWRVEDDGYTKTIAFSPEGTWEARIAGNYLTHTLLGEPFVADYHGDWEVDDGYLVLTSKGQGGGLPWKGARSAVRQYDRVVEVTKDRMVIRTQQGQTLTLRRVG